MAEAAEPTALYRPVGQTEYALIKSSGFRCFPPRLPEQLFFYPVANEAYATQIARDWNTSDEASGFVGYVLRFSVETSYLLNFPARQAGAAVHQEYWVPADQLAEFNEHMVGLIEVVARFPPTGLGLAPSRLR